MTEWIIKCKPNCGDIQSMCVEADIITVAYNQNIGGERIEFMKNVHCGKPILVDYVPLAYLDAISIKGGA